MAKPKSTSPSKAPNFPAGFKPIEHLGSFWKGEKPGDVLQGKLKATKVKHWPKSKYGAAHDATVYILTTPDGKDIEVTQSGGLGALTQVKKGQSVWICFMGMKKLKGKQAMREYSVAVK